MSDAATLARIAKALEKSAEATLRLAKACESINTNLVQIGQNMKEDQV